MEDAISVRAAVVVLHGRAVVVCRVVRVLHLDCAASAAAFPATAVMSDLEQEQAELNHRIQGTLNVPTSTRASKVTLLYTAHDGRRQKI